MKGLASFLGGLAVGAFVGMLIAPEKGSTTRDRIKECLRKRGILPSNEIDIIIDEITEGADAGFDKAERIVEEKADEILSAADNDAEKKSEKHHGHKKH